jgi:hypothetical protein
MTSLNVNLDGVEWPLLNFFLRIPNESSDRNKKKRYEIAFRKLEIFLKEKQQEVIDILTDSVRDFMTPNDAYKLRTRLDSAFQNELGEDLRDNLKSIENSLKPMEKNTIIKSKIVELRETIRQVRIDILSTNWNTSEGDSEKFVTLSQTLDLSNTLTERALSDINWNGTQAVEEANLFIGLSLFLLLRFIAMVKNKVSLESLIYTLSLVQVAMEEREISSFA